MKDKKQRGVCLDIPTIIEEAKKIKAVVKSSMTFEELEKLLLEIVTDRNDPDPDPDKMIRMSWETPTR